MLFHEAQAHSVGHSIVTTGQNPEAEIERITCLQTTKRNATQRHTCYIARLVKISQCDRVGIHLTYNNTVIDLGHNKSFWGLIKVVDFEKDESKRCPLRRHL